MDPASPQFAQLKSSLKSAWMAGDFGEVAKHAAHEGEAFVGQLGLKPGDRVLDVACGTGNTAIPAARSGADVVGVDIATNLLDQARGRASAEKLPVKFKEGDAEDLPFGDAEFDIVISMFGAMFAPRPERVSEELLRVCKPAGVIAMANWTPTGFVGKTFRATAELAPPPPGIQPPVLWGDPQVVRQRFSKGVANITTTLRLAHFVFPFPPREVVSFFRKYFGPTQTSFSRLDAAGQAKLADTLESMWIEHNQASDGSTSVDAEYLEVRVTKA